MTKFISLKTSLPGPKSQEIAKRRERYIAKPMGSSLSPCYIAHGEGALITDVDGNQFIDLTGGWGCLAVGHTHKKVVAAIKDQVEKYLHTDFTAIPYECLVELAEKLVNLSPGNTPKAAAFFNSGAEAVENAVKIARAHTGRSAIIVFENAFHGRTLLTMTMTHKAMPYKYHFGPFAPEVYRLPFPCSSHPITNEDFEKLLVNTVTPDSVAAIVVEPIQGEGGFNVPQEGFLEYLRELTNKYGMLLVTDEIQSGIGRTGKFFAIENWDIEPDIVCLAKSLAAGLPLSAVIAKKEITDSLPGGCIGGTYVGNPLACRAALEVIKIIEEEHLLDRALKIGERLKERFLKMKGKYSIVGEVRGIGAMMAIELVKDRKTREPAAQETARIVQECIKNGVFIATAGINKNLLRMLVSLEITDEQLDEALDVLEKAIAKV
ncbi:4-aminobutyrate--2-oxoglutarate transaminase [Candidatus Atribacteria bacterium RBG_19FT_COMBO_35_14]|uniref:4-aminobutyrate--2-oxoglutarate transaminase n=1 Tax=Candidatus Sediminicultor quintus TaxID=1797291 RepID=A0A1F5A7G5_9BACT|nr:MAG: 4-aminobutyrate--2-oxoglutarate transaminase [Candidatus Atribacteria bacterium RBG_19FT_COMBO_35_14]